MSAATPWEPINPGPGDELRARHALNTLAGHGIAGTLAYDETGRPTGLVAVDPQELVDWLADSDCNCEACGCEAGR